MNFRTTAALAAAMVCGGVLCPGFVYAEEGGKAAVSGKVESLKQWFGHWKAALKKKAIQTRYRRGVSVTSVAAVRGSKQGDADPRLPYWKGSWSEKKSEERLKEREEQAAAVELILEGKYAEAEAALDAFEKAHPSSGYLKDIAEARAKLKELRAAGSPAEAAAPAVPKAETVAPEPKPESEAEPAEAAEDKAPPEKKSE